MLVGCGFQCRWFGYGATATMNGEKKIKEKKLINNKTIF